MIITKNNYTEFIDTFDSEKNGVKRKFMVLDISIEKTGKGISHIDYLPEGLEVLHLGDFCSVEGVSSGWIRFLSKRLVQNFKTLLMVGCKSNHDGCCD